MSCPDCIKGVILPGEPIASVVDVGVENCLIKKAYLSSGADAKLVEGGEKKAIVLLTDIFGLNLVNNKIIADKFAKELPDCDVWVPDLFNGEIVVGVYQLKTPERAGERLVFFDYLRLFCVLLSRLPKLIRNRPSVCDERSISFIETLRKEKGYTKIGMAGYCFGGGIAGRIAASHPTLADTSFMAHPSPLTPATLQQINIPTSWAMAEEDMGLSHEARLKMEAVFSERTDKVEYEFKDYKGTTHGFAARPVLAYPEVKAGFEGAFDQAVAWFRRTLA